MDLFVGGEESDSILRALGIRLGEDVFCVAALAFKWNLFADDALWSEVVVVDLFAGLFGQLEDWEGFCWTDEDRLTSRKVTFREERLCEDVSAPRLLIFRRSCNLPT